MKYFTIPMVLVLLICLAQLVFGLDNHYCYNKPGGDTSGGANCATVSCYSDGTGVFYYRHIGISYNKCGSWEGKTCNESAGGNVGDGGPLCAYKNCYDSVTNCKANSSGWTVQTFYSNNKNCSL